VVRLPGLHAPVVFDTLTGLAAYHPRDNAFAPYARLMRFVTRYYEVRDELRGRGEGSARSTPAARTGRLALAGEVA
jgi:hypothetical protein